MNKSWLRALWPPRLGNVLVRKWSVAFRRFDHFWSDVIGDKLCLIELLFVKLCDGLLL